MKKIIITGCNGQLGRAMNKVLDGNSEYELVNTDVAELDITDIDAVLVRLTGSLLIRLMLLVRETLPLPQKNITLSLYMCLQTMFLPEMEQLRIQSLMRLDLRACMVLPSLQVRIL